MKVFESLKTYYNQSFGLKTLVAGSEAESLQIKELLFGLGAEVVSDRDVVTLDYLLTQKLMQEEQVTIVEDYLFPYIERSLSKSVTSDCIKVIKNFPDPFIEESLFDVLEDFFVEKEDLSFNFEKMKESLALAKRSLDMKTLPRGLVKLGLGKLLESAGQYILLDTVLWDLPIDFQEQFRGGVLDTQANPVFWSKQLDLFKITEDKDFNFNFKNFNSQIDEVRYVLSELSSLPEGDISAPLFLYPKNRGYETLFFLYQREFFKEKKINFYRKEKSYLKSCISKLKRKIELYETNYSYTVENKNKIKFNEKSNLEITLKEVLEGFEGKFTEHDLNLLSPLMNQLDSELTLPIVEWIEILSELELLDDIKARRLRTELPLKDYSYAPMEEVKKIYVLGWGDYLFKRTGENLFSGEILYALERDLGLNLVSLNKSPARDLMKNPLIWDTSVEKQVLFSERLASGSSVKPGIFKILNEKDEGLSRVGRELLEKERPSEPQEKLNYLDNKISASSLQRYDECPYKFYLEKVLKLNFEEEEDYFLSAKEEGVLIHRALEEVGNVNIEKETFQKIIESIIFSEDKDLNFFRKAALPVFVDKLWSIVSAERAYLKEKGIRKVESEKFFSFFADLEKADFLSKTEVSPSSDKVGGLYEVVGLVDRIDLSADQGAFLYDYKRADTGSISLARYTGSKLAPQLFLYCIAADRGFLGDFEDFLGFQYINVKEYKRSKGFVAKGKGEGVAMNVPQGSLVPEEKYNEKMDLFLEKFWEILGQIAKNEFKAKPGPAYPGACATCNWVGICKESETFQ